MTDTDAGVRAGRGRCGGPEVGGSDHGAGSWLVPGCCAATAVTTPAEVTVAMSGRSEIQAIGRGITSEVMR